MLVLSRKRNESIVIDGNIKITILSLDGSRVQLGLEAPPGVLIQRAEIRHAQEFAGMVPALASTSH